MGRSAFRRAVLFTAALAATVVVLGAFPVMASPTPSASDPPSSTPSAEISSPAVPSLETSLATSASISPSGEAETPSATAPHPRQPSGASEDPQRRQASTASVAVRDDVFVPASITVEVGTTVTWRNEGQNPHTVTADDRAFDSGTILSGGTFEVTFDEVGVVPYYCQIHGEPGSGMTGTVDVVAAAPGEPTGGASSEVARDGAGTASTSPDVLPRTGVTAAPLVLAIALAVAGALALRIGSARGGR